MRNLLLLLFIIITLGVSAWVLIPDGMVNTASHKAATGVAEIGGDFILTDQRGKTIDSKRLRGKWLLVFFGFTHCPDICPVGTMTISQVADRMKEDRLAPLFITIDPQRDDVKTLADFSKNFSPRLTFLTGSEASIDAVEHAYKVYAAKKQNLAMADGYQMDHSGFIYLMDPQGQYAAHFPYNVTADALADALRDRMKRP